jgi:hypothetical protein
MRKYGATNISSRPSQLTIFGSTRIWSLPLNFRRQGIQPGAERAAANFLHDSLELTPIQPNSTALMAAIKRETLEGVSLKRAGTFGTASRRFHRFDLSKLLAELFQHFPILLGKVNVFLGSLHKSHSVTKSILFGFHIAHLPWLSLSKERSFDASRPTIFPSFFLSCEGRI